MESVIESVAPVFGFTVECVKKVLCFVYRFNVDYVLEDFILFADLKWIPLQKRCCFFTDLT